MKDHYLYVLSGFGKSIQKYTKLKQICFHVLVLSGKLGSDGKQNTTYPSTRGVRIVALSISSHTWLRRAVGNVSGNRCESECRSRDGEFDPGPLSYFCGD